MHDGPGHFEGAPPDLTGLRRLVDVDEPVIVRVRHEPAAASARLLVALGAGWIVEASAPPCARSCGRKECKVTVVAAEAFKTCDGCQWYSTCSADRKCWDAVRVEQEAEQAARAAERRAAAPRAKPADGADLLARMDAGEPLPHAEMLEETGPAVPPRSSTTTPRPAPAAAPDPGASGGARQRGSKKASPVTDRWPRPAIIAALRADAIERGHIPQKLEWAGPSTDGHPNTGHVDKVFGNWGTMVEEAGYPRPRRGQRPVPVDANGDPVAAGTELSKPPVRSDTAGWIKVPGTGLVYRTPVEAYIAADEIEADGDRVAKAAREDGNDGKADQAVDAAHDLAEKIRAAARAADERQAAAAAPPEPEPRDDHERDVLSVDASPTEASPSAPSPGPGGANPEPREAPPQRNQAARVAL